MDVSVEILLMRIPCCCLSFCFFGLFKDGQWSSWGIPPWVSFWLLLLLLLGSCEAFLLNSQSSAAIQCAGARELHPHGPHLRGLVLVYTKLRLNDQKNGKNTRKPANLAGFAQWAHSWWCDCQPGAMVGVTKSSENVLVGNIFCWAPTAF